MAPASEPWSVRVTDGISSRAAFAASAGIRHAPSRIEYSEWTCRWTNEALTGGRSYRPGRTRFLGRQRRQHRYRESISPEVTERPARRYGLFRDGDPASG